MEAYQHYDRQLVLIEPPVHAMLPSLFEWGIAQNLTWLTLLATGYFIPGCHGGGRILPTTLGHWYGPVLSF